MNAFPRRGACPALSSPMQTGDGLLVRLNPLAGGFSPATLVALCKAALQHGNGVVEVTGRGSLQIRGLTSRSAILLARDVDGLGMKVRTGAPVEHGALAGLDPDETADPRPLAGRIREAVRNAGLDQRLGRKVSVVLDGGGHSGLGAIAADVRLTAGRHCGRLYWALAVGGGSRTARPLAMLPEELAAIAAVTVLEAVAALGPAGHGRDLDAGQLARLAALQPAGEPPSMPPSLADARLSHMEVPPPLTPPHKGEGDNAIAAGDNAIAASSKFIDAQMPDAAAQFPLPLVGMGQGWGCKGGPGTSRIPCAISIPAGGRMLVPSILPLRGGASALAVAVPFGQMDADGLIGLAARAEEFRASEIRLAPGRIVLALCPAEAEAMTLRQEAGRLGFVISPHDPRAGISACPGAPACGSGRIPARSLAALIGADHGDILDGSLGLHVSGCAKGCANPAKAALALVGGEDGAGLVVDGTARGMPLARTPAEHALDSFGRVAGLIRAERQPGETSAACVARLGGRRLAEAFEKG